MVIFRPFLFSDDLCLRPFKCYSLSPEKSTCSETDHNEHGLSLVEQREVVGQRDTRLVAEADVEAAQERRVVARHRHAEQSRLHLDGRRADLQAATQPYQRRLYRCQHRPADVTVHLQYVTDTSFKTSMR